MNAENADADLSILFILCPRYGFASIVKDLAAKVGFGAEVEQ
jgi:hypothetical protein